MYMLVGLGNPGLKYRHTRHNAGFDCLDVIAKKYGVTIKKKEKNGITGVGNIAGEKVLFVKPQTFMNNSGEAVHLAAMFYRVPISRILILSDDVSLPVGRVRVRAEGSAGGHNGLKSVISHLGSQEFPRVKIGVGAKPHPDYNLADWVLSIFTAQEGNDLAPALEHAAGAAL